MAGMMRSPSRSLVSLAAAAALGAAHPVASAAQVTARQVGVDRAAPGWIGVNLEVSQLHGPEGRIDSELVIRGVVDGSPADEAEIRPGDRIVRLNGQPASFEAFSRLAAGLRAGDRFRVTLVRDGWTQEVTLEAEPKPATELVALPGPVVDRLDSAIRRLDSVRVRITRSEDSTAALAASDAPPPLAGVARMMAVGPDSTRTVIFYPAGEGVTGWSHVLSGEGSRVSVSFPSPPGEESSYRFLRREPDEIRALPGEVEARAARERTVDLQRLIEDSLSRAPGPVSVGPAPAPAGAPFEFRPLTPYIVGQNRVAGAALTPLNPGLASYFDVDGGLLVTDVADGTPADEAGLAPGDVIVRVGETGVASLMDLRRLLSRTGAGGVSFDLVRRGESLRVTLPR